MVLVVKNTPVSTGDEMRGSDAWVGEIPWRSAWQPAPVLPENPMDSGAWRRELQRVHHTQRLHGAPGPGPLKKTNIPRQGKRVSAGKGV